MKKSNNIKIKGIIEEKIPEAPPPSEHEYDVVMQSYSEEEAYKFHNLFRYFKEISKMRKNMLKMKRLVSLLIITLIISSLFLYIFISSNIYYRNINKYVNEMSIKQINIENKTLLLFASNFSALFPVLTIQSIELNITVYMYDLENKSLRLVNNSVLSFGSFPPNKFNFSCILNSSDNNLYIVEIVVRTKDIVFGAMSWKRTDIIGGGLNELQTKRD